MFTDKNILILDDDQMVLDSLVFFINQKNKGNTITTYSNIDDFRLNYTRTYENKKDCVNDAIIIDFYLGQKTGPEIIKKIRSFNKDIFIIATSGAFVIEANGVRCINKDIMKTALNMGASRVIPKVMEDIIDALDVHFKIESDNITSV